MPIVWEIVTGEAEAEVHIGTEAMKDILPMEGVVVAEGLAKGNDTMKVGQEDTEAICTA